MPRELAAAQRHAGHTPQAFRNFRMAFRLAQMRGDGQAAAELALEQVVSVWVPPDLIVRTLTEGLAAVPDPESELAALLHVHMAGPQGEEHWRQAQDLAARHGYQAVELLLAARAFEAAVAGLEFGRIPALERRFEELEAAVGRTEMGIGRAIRAIGPSSLGTWPERALPRPSSWAIS